MNSINNTSISQKIEIIIIKKSVQSLIKLNEPEAIIQQLRVLIPRFVNKSKN